MILENDITSVNHNILCPCLSTAEGPLTDFMVYVEVQSIKHPKYSRYTVFFLSVKPVLIVTTVAALHLLHWLFALEQCLMLFKSCFIAVY